jgi:hypothetical protein
MKSREVKLANGQTLTVPQGIQRIDSPSTHGWQVRYQGSRLFSDGPSADAQLSLKKALLELMTRMNSLPAPPALNRGPSAHKTSDLPSGISGPIVRQRVGRAFTAELSVLLPRFGQRAQLKKIHIGSPNTYTEDKYRAALEKGVAMRKQATERYALEADKARRNDVAQLRGKISALRAKP